jgi:hypothetical protein
MFQFLGNARHVKARGEQGEGTENHEQVYNNARYRTDYGTFACFFPDVKNELWLFASRKEFERKLGCSDLQLGRLTQIDGMEGLDGA